MSRIAKALEKAARLRQSTTGATSASTITSRDNLFPHHVFEAGELIIDVSAVERRLVCITDPSSHAAEQYKKLRARIAKTTDRDFVNSILVTSSQAGEGKTVTAINLAVTIARELDHTVLLIDTDLRKPSVHTYLGITPQYGLSDYLQSKAQLSDILIKTGIGKLVLLPAGTPPANPAELLASEKMRDLVREVKYRYQDRYVIFDASPLLTSADVLYLKEYVDGIIFVVQAARTSKKSAAQALALIKGSRIFGTVFNNVPPHFSTNSLSYAAFQEGPGSAFGLMEWAGKLFR